MNNKLKISIIMNCYNGQRFLKESLNSIINQHFKNWELIFWDNQSTDNSRKIFLDFKDKRFKYFLSKKFTNLYAARNNAIQKCKGQIITFIDTDDIWLPQKLQKQVEFFKKNKSAEIVYSNYFVQKKILGITMKKIKFSGHLPSGKITRDLLMNYRIGWLTVALKRNIVKNKKKLFNEKIDMVADFDLMIRLSQKKNIYCIQEPLAIYRYHQYQLTRRNFINQVDHFLLWSKSLSIKKLLKNQGNLKILNNKIKFFQEVKLIYKGNYTFFRVYKNFFDGEIKLSLKLIIFIFFPNLFTKYILTI